MELGKLTAVAGITATAVVGVAGIASGWLSARDDRVNERALAREDRAHERALAQDAQVYARRAEAYLAALRVVDLQRREIDAREENMSALGRSFAAPGSPTRDEVERLLYDPPKFSMVADADAETYVRLVAYGTDEVVKQYDQLRTLAGEVWAARQQLANLVSHRPLPLQTIVRKIRLELVTSGAESRFFQHQHALQLLIQDALT